MGLSQIIIRTRERAGTGTEIVALYDVTVEVGDRNSGDPVDSSSLLRVSMTALP